MSNYEQTYQKYLLNFDNQLKIAIEKFYRNAPETLSQAMQYAVDGGGKRIRPVLCFATAEFLGLELSAVNEFAVAIEMIHSYSLVHDDLPSMDNDDYRRGKLSTHKKFGEAYGILAGDALLNFAFEHCLGKINFSNNDVKALKILANYAGHTGMIAGQVLDLQNEHNDNPNEKVLYDIYYNKTAKLIIAPLIIASVLAGNKHYESLKEYGYNLGIMFQISDDIMDVEGNVELIGKTPNKDAIEDKLTSIKVFGLNGAKEKLKFHYETCIKLLTEINASKFLFDFTNHMYQRKK